MEFVKEKLMYNETPWPLRYQDMYSISSDDFASSEAKEYSFYTITNRRSPVEAFPEVAKDSRTMFFGLSDFIMRHMRHKITKDEVLEAAIFCRRAHSFGGEIYFPLEKWMYIVEKCNGYIPVQIQAIREGHVSFPNIPHIHIRNTIEGFGEFAASFEAGLVGMTSIASARLTLERHWLERLREWVSKDVKTTDPEVLDATARWMIHDFSMRACATPEESEIMGLAHLLVFNGSDNSNACYQAWKRGANPVTGTSIQAMAHRNVQGFSAEENSFNAMHQSARHGSVNIASYLVDCYNFENAVKQHITQLANKYKNDIFVTREDSGDALKNVLCILNAGPQNMRFLSGNSLNPTKCDSIMNGLVENNFPATQRGIFGIGGYLRRTPTRDSLSTALKLVAVGSTMRPVVKLSEDQTKLSVPGPNDVLFKRDGVHVDISTYNSLPTYYHSDKDGPSYGNECERPFNQLQKMTIESFNAYDDIAKINPNYGLNGECWSDKIKLVQQQYIEKYRK